MRLILQIFATVFIVSLLSGGLLMSGIDFKRYDEIVSFSAALPDDMKDLITAKDAQLYRQAGTVWLVLAGGCIAGIVAVWLRKRIFGLVCGGVLAVLGLIVYALQPGVQAQAEGFESVGTNVLLFGGVGVVILFLLHTVVKE